MIHNSIDTFTAELPPMVALAGLDLGTRTIGVAVSDSFRSVATPLETVKRKKFGVDAAALVKILQARGIGGVALGIEHQPQIGVQRVRQEEQPRQRRPAIRRVRRGQQPAEAIRQPEQDRSGLEDRSVIGLESRDAAGGVDTAVGLAALRAAGPVDQNRFERQTAFKQRQTDHQGGVVGSVMQAQVAGHGSGDSGFGGAAVSESDRFRAEREAVPPRPGFTES